MWRERFCYYVLHRRARRSLVNPCGRGVNAFALMLSKNSVVQCVSNLLRGSSTFFFSATFRHTDEESLIDIFCNLIALGFTRIRSGSLGFDRSLERERDTRDTKNFRYKNTVVNTVFIPFYIHPPPRQYIYSSSHHGNPPWNNLTPKQYVVNFFKCRSVLSLSLSTYHSAQWTKTKLSFALFQANPERSNITA